MTNETSRGFTIIEVMLFLAITAGIFAALMVGVNTAVTQQRYLDSVRSYKALIQNQYAEVLTTRNADTEDWKCSSDNDGSVTDTEGRRTADDTRGASQCVIMGRSIRITNDGKSVVISSVTGYDPMTASLADSDDVTAISLYKPKVAAFDQETLDIDWGAHLIRPTADSSTPASTAAILILRSPSSGAVRVFASEDKTDAADIISSAGLSSTTQVKMCVEGDSGLLPKQMVLIDPRIGGADAVKADGGENEECQ